MHLVILQHPQMRVSSHIKIVLPYQLQSQTDLTFLTDDILREIAMSQKNYFKLNKENSKNGREHYFEFREEVSEESQIVRSYKYHGIYSVLLKILSIVYRKSLMAL